MGHSCSTIGTLDSNQLLPTKSDSDIRVLVLGAASSGKTTLAKQMRVWLSSGFTTAERHIGRQLMIYNLVKGIQERLQNKPSDCTAESDMFHPRKLFRLDGETKLDEQQLAEIRRVYPRLRNIPSDQCSIPNDLMEYAFSMLSSLALPTYLLNDEEMIRIRLRTSGKRDLVFDHDGYRWTFTDAGGQRNERSKWERFAEGMDASVFVVALDEWDVPDIDQDGSHGLTKMESAKKIFADSAALLTNKPLVVLFNRYDLFCKKISGTSIRQHPIFASYTGHDDPLSSFAYIKDWFCEDVLEKERILAAPIAAISTEDVKKVGKNMMDFILSTIQKADSTDQH